MPLCSMVVSRIRRDFAVSKSVRKETSDHAAPKSVRKDSSDAHGSLASRLRRLAGLARAARSAPSAPAKAHSASNGKYGKSSLARCDHEDSAFNTVKWGSGVTSHRDKRSASEANAQSVSSTRSKVAEDVSCSRRFVPGSKPGSVMIRRESVKVRHGSDWRSSEKRRLDTEWEQGSVTIRRESVKVRQGADWRSENRRSEPEWEQVRVRPESVSGRAAATSRSNSHRSAQGRTSRSVFARSENHSRTDRSRGRQDMKPRVWGRRKREGNASGPAESPAESAGEVLEDLDEILRRAVMHQAEEAAVQVETKPKADTDWARNNRGSAGIVSSTPKARRPSPPRSPPLATGPFSSRPISSSSRGATDNRDGGLAKVPLPAPRAAAKPTCKPSCAPNIQWGGDSTPGPVAPAALSAATPKCTPSRAPHISGSGGERVTPLAPVPKSRCTYLSRPPTRPS